MGLPLSAGRMFAGIFSCTQPHAPHIAMLFYNNPPQIKLAQSTAHMMALRQKSISPDYGGEFPHVDGITDGTFSIKYDLDFTAVEQMMFHTACVRTKDARITITYTPVIYISSKVVPGSCLYRETITHEMRHVAADVGTVNTYLPLIKSAAVSALVPQHDPRPIKQTQIKDFQANESKKLSQAMDKVTTALQRTRQIRQMKIDTRKEYERLSHACPNERR